MLINNFSNSCFSANLSYLREALGNKTLVLYNEPGGPVFRARRARYTSPLGRVVECGGWTSRGLWVMFSIGVLKSPLLSSSFVFRQATGRNFLRNGTKFGHNMYF